MARRYLNIFKTHIIVMILLVILIAASELTEGTMAAFSKVATGLLLIYIAFNYALWLLKAPIARMDDENKS